MLAILTLLQLTPGEKFFLCFKSRLETIGYHSLIVGLEHGNGRRTPDAFTLIKVILVVKLVVSIKVVTHTNFKTLVA